MITQTFHEKIAARNELTRNTDMSLKLHTNYFTNIQFTQVQKDFRRVNLAVNKELNATPELEKRSTRRTFC